MLTSQKLRWGIVGCANIAIKSLIPAILASETGVVSAIASRGIEKAKATADKLGISTAYGSYESLIEDPSIDIVYIPLPNHLHAEWTIRAANAGKHVLCEKPLALHAEQAAEMVSTAKQAGVLLAEAFMYRHHPRYDLIKQMIADGAIGELRGLHGAFTFNSADLGENVRFHSAMGGGSLYDVGCYPIHASRHIMGVEPEAITVHALFSERHDHVDMMASGLLEFPGHVALTFDCGMWAEFRNTLEILGTNGRIVIPSAYVAPATQEANFFLHTNGEIREIEVPKVNQYTMQVDAIGKSILAGAPYRFSAEDAIANMRVIDACLLSGKTRSRVMIS